MPHGRMKHLQRLAGRIYNLLKKEAAYGPNTQHLEDFRTAQKLEKSLDRPPGEGSGAGNRFGPPRLRDARREAS